MTFVPKKKSDSRSATANNSSASTTTNSAATNSNNKASAASVAPVAAKEANQQDQLDEQHYQDHQLQQHRRSPEVQCSSSASGAGDKMGQEEANYVGYNGDEHNHDRRHNQHHHHHHHHQNHHHHNNHHQHHNKYMNPKSDNDSNVNHIILITVINPHYPITCDLIHQICSNYGKVNRIVIFKKNGVQAMVEFDNVESAKRARAMLNGCDIYSGCCTLKIEFAKPSRLNVHRNDSESFDYTNPNLVSGPPAMQATSDSGHDDNHHQPNHHNHHQQQQPHHHHHHHLQQTSSAGHHSTYLHGATPHHARGPGGVGGRRGGGLGGIGGDMNSTHSNTVGHNHHHQHANQFHPSQHMHQPPSSHHQHSKQSIPTQGQQHGGLQQATSYVLGQAIDESMINTSDSAESTFHQQQHQDGGGFSIPRGGVASEANVGAGAAHQENFAGGLDTFIPTSTAQQSATHLSPHTIHGSMYHQRQDGGHPHQHNQSHHQSHHQIQARGRVTGNNIGRTHGHHNPSFPPMNSIGALMAGSGSAHQGTVLMVYGLSVDRINCDRLFNLFCLYGNVVRVSRVIMMHHPCIIHGIIRDALSEMHYHHHGVFT
jgi:hypothetical protein